MIDRLTDLLRESRELGYLGPGPVTDHVAHALAFAAVVGEAPRLALDLGAGGGLPGLVLAATVWPATRWTFLDSQAKRTTFLAYAVETLGMADRVTVVTGRAEEISREEAHRAAYDLVVARSFGAPAVTAECAVGFLVVGGLLVVSEPPQPDTAARWPASGLAQLGLGAPVASAVAGDPPTHLVVMKAVGSVDDRFPRRVGIPAKRPLF